MGSAKLAQKNRKRFFKNWGKGMVLLVAEKESLRNGDVHHEFRQDSDFWYLTGVEEPGYALLLDGKTQVAHLFIPNINELHQIWIGKQLSVGAAKKQYGFQKVYHFSEFKTVLSSLSKNSTTIFTTKTGKAFLKEQGLKHKTDTTRLSTTLHKLRLYKESEEISFLKQANRISAKGHIAAMQSVRAGMYEYQLQALLEQAFRHHGARHNAYSSIVASGPNAAILHYTQNNRKIRSNDLVLIDAGCEYNGYASDITRTFPCQKKFTLKQRQIYELVLAIQNTCIRLAKPGTSLQGLHSKACEMVIKGLIELKLLYPHSLETHFEHGTHRLFFPHGLGHLLGLDVHDVGAPKRKPTKKKATQLRSPITLEPGVVITVEPGIYFIEAHFTNAQKRRQLKKLVNWSRADQYQSVGGIRIEDDVLITQTGHRNLTTVPKNVDDIESL